MKAMVQFNSVKKSSSRLWPTTIAIGVTSFLAMATTACSVTTEQAKYSVVTEYTGFEVREYPQRVIAETYVTVTPDNEDDVDSIGFRRLAGYIFAKNREEAAEQKESKNKSAIIPADEKISMTTPVITEEVDTQKIAMTTPVLTTKDSGTPAQSSSATKTVRMAFVMPAKFSTISQLPAPIDPNVKLVEEKPHRVAAWRADGSWSEEKFQENIAAFKNALNQAGLKTDGEPTIARYNPPWEPWFMKRNEIIWRLAN